MSWDRQAGETDEWYERFMLYLYMGPDRTITAAHNFATRLAQRAAHGQIGSWHRMARRHRWKERASAFDAELGRKSLDEPAAEETTDEASQVSWTDEERMRMVAVLLHQVYGVLRHADLLTLSKEEARQLLPTFRLFFRDLLRFHQIEVAQMLATGNGDEATALSADDWMRLLQEHGGMERVANDLRRVTESLAGEARWRPLRDVLAQLYPDEPSARRIAAQAHLDSRRIHFSGRAVDGWHAILTEAAHTGQLERVIDAVWQEYGSNPVLAKAVQTYRG
jgi:hypothetical protein